VQSTRPCLHSHCSVNALIIRPGLRIKIRTEFTIYLKSSKSVSVLSVHLLSLLIRIVRFSLLKILNVIVHLTLDSSKWISVHKNTILNRSYVNSLYYRWMEWLLRHFMVLFSELGGPTCDGPREIRGVVRTEKIQTPALSWISLWISTHLMLSPCLYS
jgi:hypothetical protein